MSCIWCGIDRSYYVTVEHASRQNCHTSDSGYHEFSEFGTCIRWFDCLRQKRRAVNHERLLRHRREKRPNTI